MSEANNFAIPKYGEIWLLRNPERIKELGKDYRPVLIISQNERNEHDNSIVVVPLTTDDLENVLPVEVFIKNTSENGLKKSSKILCDSPFTWDKGLRFKEKLGVADSSLMKQVKKAWQIAFFWE